MEKWILRWVIQMHNTNFNNPQLMSMFSSEQVPSRMTLVIMLSSRAGLMCQTTTSNLFKQRIVASLPHRQSLLISADIHFKKTLYSSKDVYSEWVGGVHICVCACTRTGVCVCLSSIECLQSEGLVSDFRPFLRQDQAHPTSHHTWTQTTFPQDRANFLKHPCDCVLTRSHNNRNQFKSPSLTAGKSARLSAVPAWLRCPQ